LFLFLDLVKPSDFGSDDDIGIGKKQSRSKKLGESKKKLYKHE